MKKNEAKLIKFRISIDNTFKNLIILYIKTKPLEIFF